jgi:hypothetical protein
MENHPLSIPLNELARSLKERGLPEKEAEDLADEVFERFTRRIAIASGSSGRPANLLFASAISNTRLAFYLLVCALVSFVLLKLVTDDEVMVALGTLNLAIIGMWVWALRTKIRLLSQALHRSQQN